MRSVLEAQLRRCLPRTQEDCIAISVRQSLAAYGRLDDRLVPAACYGLVKGLFGPAFDVADLQQRVRWFSMAKRQYARLTGREAPQSPEVTSEATCAAEEPSGRLR